MDATQADEDVELVNGRRFSSPNRVLVRSFRMSRDRWREKHHQVQAKLEQERQLATERGQSRDSWRQKFEAADVRAEAAELVAQQRLCDLESLRERCEQLERQVAEKKVEPDVSTDLVVPAGGSVPLSIIQRAVKMVCTAGSALRAVPRLFEIFRRDDDPEAIIPSASGVRSWLLRLGLYALRECLPVANDWLFLIDHSVQVGPLKACVIVGLRQSELPVPTRPLQLRDLHLLGLHPVETSNGEVVLEQLEQAAQRVGIPREIGSDHGSDVKRGSELFVARHPETRLAYDAAHHGAIVLKKRLEAHPLWSAFNTELGKVKAKLLQTPDAYLVSPSPRSKARFMNVGSQLKWSRAILRLIDRGASGGRASERALER